MHIFFGYELDSASFPDALGQKAACQGIAVLGPLGLVGVLETSLGLSGRRAPQAVRISQYLKRLKETDDGQRFYSRSLEVDAWSVAKQLLAWRDDLVLSGWQGEIPQGAGPRLQDLAAMEQLHHLELAPGLGDRLQEVLSALPAGRRLAIRCVRLVEPRSSLPPCWGKLFAVLARRGVTVEEGEDPKPGSAKKDISDLTILHQALRGKMPESGALRGDGSLFLIRGANAFEVSEAIASWLEAYEDLSEVLIIRGGGSVALDEALHAHNLPGLGRDSRSRWRTALQVLPLFLANHWEPFDPQRLLEILTLPKSPIPRWASLFFEKALRDHPGLGGPKWQEAWKAVLAGYQARASEQNRQDRARASVEAFQGELRFWLGERRFDPKQGMPAEVIQEICSKVAAWASTRGGMENDAVLLTSASFAKAVADSVASSGLARITLPQLNRMLDSVVGEGLEHPDAFPQAAPWSQVETPGQVWGPAATLVWWNFTSAGVNQRRLPWTLAERQALGAVGVDLEDTRRTRVRESGYWQRAALFARKQLVLVIPESLAGEVVAPHPFWDEIRHLLKLGEADIQQLTFKAQELWEKPEQRVIDRLAARKAVPEIPLAAPCREWSIPPVAALPRERESASSLSKLIHCPLSWVFQYQAKLYRGDLMALPGVSQILGTLCHLIIETLVSESGAWTPEEAEQRALQVYDEYVPKIAAVLTHPGRELERSRYRRQLGQAVNGLFTLIKAADLKIVGYEVTKERDFPEGKRFGGRIDLVLAGAEGDSVILDLKWAKRARYKGEELRGGKALQLAAYGWLLEGEQGRFPAGGYFMLAQGDLLVSSCRMFPEHHVVQEVTLEDIWQQSLNACRQRLRQLHHGLAVAEGIQDLAEAEDPIAPAGAQDPEEILEPEPPCRWCAYINLCGAGDQE